MNRREKRVKRGKVMYLIRIDNKVVEDNSSISISGLYFCHHRKKRDLYGKVSIHNRTLPLTPCIKHKSGFRSTEDMDTHDTCWDQVRPGRFQSWSVGVDR